MRVTFVKIPIASLWQEPLAYARYRINASLMHGRYVCACVAEEDSPDWDNWRKAHGNETYDRVRTWFTVAGAAAVALYVVNDQSKDHWATPAQAAAATVAGALVGALLGHYAHYTVPAVVGYKAFAFGFKQLKKYHKKKQ